MLVTRFNNSDTKTNLQVLLTLIQDSSCTEVRIFASPSSVTPEFGNSDGPESNLPLIAALVQYNIPGITDVYVIFDGLFLTAARRPRLGEVQDLLDAAQTSGKTLISTVAAPFTSSMDAAAAVNLLLSLKPMSELTAATRPEFFALLALAPEEQYSL